MLSRGIVANLKPDISTLAKPDIIILVLHEILSFPILSFPPAPNVKLSGANPPGFVSAGAIGYKLLLDSSLINNPILLPGLT